MFFGSTPGLRAALFFFCLELCIWRFGALALWPSGALLSVSRVRSDVLRRRLRSGRFNDDSGSGSGELSLTVSLAVSLSLLDCPSVRLSKSC